MGIRCRPVTAPALSVTVSSYRPAHVIVDAYAQASPEVHTDVPSALVWCPQPGGRTPVTSNQPLKSIDILYIVGTFTSPVPAKSPPCEGNPRLTATGVRPAEPRSSHEQQHRSGPDRIPADR